MSMPCPSDNPCNCIKGIVSNYVPKPECPNISESCILACSDILACEEAVGPCGQTGTFDLTTLNHNFGGCQDPTAVRWSLKGDAYKEILLSANIDRNTGVLTWVTKGPETVGKFAEVCFAITCVGNCENCLALEDIGTFYIGVKDECVAHGCDNKCEECDPCSGDCIDNSGTIKIEE